MTGTDRYDEQMRMNFGIEANGGVLVQVEFHDCSSCYNGGSLIFYLDNGETIKCFDRNITESINGHMFRYYKLTRDEVHKLEDFNTDAIDLKVISRKFGPQTKRFLYHRFIDTYPNPRLETERIDGYLTNFFRPYWEKRDD